MINSLWFNLALLLVSLSVLIFCIRRIISLRKPTTFKDETNQTFDNQSGNHAYNKPNHTRSSKSVNGFDNSIDNQTKGKETEKP